MNGMYYFWGLLPLGFLLLVGWSIIKPWMKAHGEEPTIEYAKQSVFCFVALLIAIWFDENLLTEWANSMLIDENFVHVLTYPTVLVVLAYMQKFYDMNQQRKKAANKKKKQSQALPANW